MTDQPILWMRGHGEQDPIFDHTPLLVVIRGTDLPKPNTLSFLTFDGVFQAALLGL